MDYAKMTATLERIKELRAQSGQLLAELDRSLAIQQLWSQAFEHGRCTSSWRGRPISGRDLNGNMRYALRLRITDGAGNWQEFDQTDVPQLLWPHPTYGRLPS